MFKQLGKRGQTEITEAEATPYTPTLLIAIAILLATAAAVYLIIKSGMVKMWAP